MTAQQAKVLDLEAYKKQNASEGISNYGSILAQFDGLKEYIENLRKEPRFSSAQIFGHLLEDYKLTQTLEIMLEIYKDETIAIIPNLELYSEGATEIEAVNNLKLELVDLYEQLNSIADEKLGKELLARKRTVSGLLAKK